MPFLGILAIPCTLLLLQPDTGNTLIVVATAMAMFLTAGGKWRDFFIITLLGLLLLAVLAFSRPYVMDRITTFLDPILLVQVTK